MASEDLQNILMRRATENDLPQMIGLLANDALGREREVNQTPVLPAYLEAFRRIDADGSNDLIVACVEEQVVGLMQLTVTPHLTYQGGVRGTIEGVRVDLRHRGRGIGRQMLGWAIEYFRERGCHLVQLTTNIRRPEAKAFYESVGFAATHHGMKLQLT